MQRLKKVLKKLVRSANTDKASAKIKSDVPRKAQAAKKTIVNKKKSGPLPKKAAKHASSKPAKKAAVLAKTAPKKTGGKSPKKVLAKGVASAGKGPLQEKPLALKASTLKTPPTKTPSTKAPQLKSSSAKSVIAKTVEAKDKGKTQPAGPLTKPTKGPGKSKPEQASKAAIEPKALKGKKAAGPVAEEVARVDEGLENGLEAGADEGPEEIILTDAEGRRYCRVRECDQVETVDGYCRYHYLLFWKRIQVRKKILSEGRLERYIEELTARYPDKFLDMLRKDLRSEKEFLAAIQELEIDESQSDAEFEDENENIIEEVRGMSEAATPTREEEEF